MPASERNFCRRTTKKVRNEKCEVRSNQTTSDFPLRPSAFGLGVGLGLAEAGDTVAGFPLAAFLEELHALKALEHVAFAAQGGCGAEAAML